MKIVLNLLKLLIFILALYILTQNSGQSVAIKLLGYQNPSVPLLVVLIITLTVGAVLGAVFMAFSLIQTQSELRNLRNKNKQLMNELENLRNISIDEIPDEGLAAEPPTLEPPSEEQSLKDDR